MKRAASGMLAAAIVAVGGVAVWTGCGSSFTSGGDDDGGAGDATSSSSGGGGSSGSSGGSDASGSSSGSASSSGSSSGGAKDGGGPGDGASGDGPAFAGDAGCAATTVRCVGQQPEKCVGGQWVNAGAACVNQACVGGACTGVCAPTQTSCADAGVQETCGANGQWDIMVSCGYEQPCCNGECDLNDPKNCGSCGSGCATGNNCGNGLCAPPGTCGPCQEDIQCQAYCAPKTGFVYCCAAGTCAATSGLTCPL